MVRSRTRIFEDVVQRIRLGMATGAIAPGQRLPTERTLAAQYNASRGSLREAIRILEFLGLVTVKRGRDGGVFVNANCRELARDSFTSLLPLGQYSFEQSLEFRKIIEPRAAEMAALRATDDHLNTLRKSLAMVDEHPSPEMFVESNRLFHATVAEATGNPYVQSFLQQFFAAQDMSAAARTAGPIQRSLAQFFHARIADAIVQRNAREAGAWMDAHLAQLESDFRQSRAVT